VDSGALARVGRAAADVGTAAVIGFAERTDDGGVANSVACLDADGRARAVYRKTHLFGPAEEATFAAGDRLVVTELAGRAVAPLICFDMEFPEPARALARAGAELLVTASANMNPYAYEHELASRARAMDNRRPHVYVNRTGSEYGFDFLGASRAVDAGGRVIVEAGDGEEVLEAEIAVGAGPRDAAVDYLELMRDGLTVERAG
jgi:predicted amidohydrolase